jgi:hypothetical protein
MRASAAAAISRSGGQAVVDRAPAVALSVDPLAGEKLMQPV